MPAIHEPWRATARSISYFEGSEYLVFVAAKLTSDISESTTYDPERNQIVRNIDGVMEQAGDRRAIFWMLVDDRAQTRRYIQLLGRYRARREDLYKLLPHRDTRVIDAVLDDVAVIMWSDLLLLVADIDELAAVKAELARRISTPTEPT